MNWPPKPRATGESLASPLLSRCPTRQEIRRQAPLMMTANSRVQPRMHSVLLNDSVCAPSKLTFLNRNPTSRLGTAHSERSVFQLALQIAAVGDAECLQALDDRETFCNFLRGLNHASPVVIFRRRHPCKQSTRADGRSPQRWCNCSSGPEKITHCCCHQLTPSSRTEASDSRKLRRPYTGERRCHRCRGG